MATWTYRGNTILSLHDHDFCELFWVESGEGYHWINGECRQMSPGYLALIRPEDRHAFSARAEDGEVCFHNFAFFPSLWHRVRRRLFSTEKVFFGLTEFHEREMLLGDRFVERLRFLAADLRAGFHDRLSAEAFLTALLSLLVNYKQRLKEEKSVPPWLLRACEQIRIYPHFKGGVSAFVQSAGRSPEHVARETRKHFGKTPRDLVNEARLAHAAAQLCTTSQPILDILFDAGFENVGHFYQLFRKNYGRSPHQYRVHYRRGEAYSLPSARNG